MYLEGFQRLNVERGWPGLANHILACTTDAHLHLYPLGNGTLKTHA